MSPSALPLSFRGTDSSVSTIHFVVKTWFWSESLRLNYKKGEMTRRTPVRSVTPIVDVTKASTDLVPRYYY